jgi:hypothetical protein
MFRPRRFSRPRRLTPPRASWACFIPQPRPGFTLQGLSPLPSRSASSTSRALLPLRCVPLPPIARWRQGSQRRLQGVDPSSDPLRSRWGLASETLDPLVRFHSLRLCSRNLGGAFTPPAPAALVLLSYVSSEKLTLSVSIGSWPDSLSPESPPVRAFRPAVTRCKQRLATRSGDCKATQQSRRTSLPYCRRCAIRGEEASARSASPR